MATQVFGLRTHTDTGLRLTYKNRQSRETVAKVEISQTNIVGEYLAATEEGQVIGHRHESIGKAVWAVEDTLRLDAIYLDREHPSVIAWCNGK